MSTTLGQRSSMRSIDEDGLRELVKASFRGRITSDLKTNEPLAYQGMIIPPRAEIFFPKGRDDKRSHHRAIIYIKDVGGSVVDLQPGKIQLKPRTGNTLSAYGSRSMKSQSISGRMYDFS